MLKKLMSTGLGIGVIVIIVLAVICFVPMVFLWAVNSLSEAGGSSFYIEHTLYNYIVAFVALVILRASN